MLLLKVVLLKLETNELAIISSSLIMLPFSLLVLDDLCFTNNGLDVYPYSILLLPKGLTLMIIKTILFFGCSDFF